MKSTQPDRRPREKLRRGVAAARTHDALVLAGCRIHTQIDEAALGWLSRTLRCAPDAGDPPAGAFDQLEMTMQVVTFDDIDTCTRIATSTLDLSPIASIGVRELLVNAVEHGNLGITFEEKSELLKFGRWQEEIEQRLGSPELHDKFATVLIGRDADRFTIEIRDQGDGFDWEGYLEMGNGPSTLLHGRGMSLAMSAGFSAVEYRGTGNEVCVSGKCGQT